MTNTEAVVYAVFSDGPGGGNPCPVIPSADHLSTDEMLSITGRYGHESVFLLAPTTSTARARVRYFVPEHEMEMCVHATVAAVTWLHETGHVSPGDILVETPLGILRTELTTKAAVVVEQFPPTVGHLVPTAVHAIAEAIGCQPDRIVTADTPRSVSVSRAKMLVELDGLATLEDLRPDAARIRQVCDDLDVTGLYPFAVPSGGRRAWARQFPRNSGYLEDAATGVAAAALGTLLIGREAADGTYSYEILQGQAMNHPSRMTVLATRDGRSITRVAVSGHARR